MLNHPKLRLSDIVARLGGELTGDPDVVVDRIGPLDGATPTTISFLSNPRYQSHLSASQAGCVIVQPALRELARGSTIATSDPYLYFARLTQWWGSLSHDPAPAGVHASAVIEPDAFVHPTASVGALSFVGTRARIEAGAVISAQVHVGQHCSVGSFSRVAPHVTIERGCHIGERCTLHSGVVIGADGFGFASHEGRWEKIEQLGTVRVGNDVEVGANTCIDRGALEDTVIGDGVKLDNLIQIAHNVRIGAHTAMAGCVGVAGSTTIGAHCMIGGAAMILGHLQLVDYVEVSAATLVTRSILQPGRYTGVFPFDDNAAWEKNAAALRHLYALRQRVRALENRFA